MNQEKYIGMDVHQATISVAIMDSSGKLIVESILETKAATILEFIQGLRGSLSVTFEEGTSAAWLHDLLKPHVTDLVVCDPRKNALLKDGSKSDRIDARKLAELLRGGQLKPVYHGEHGLRTLKESCREVTSSDSFHRADSCGVAGRAAADTTPFPYQATTVGLQWFRRRDSRQRRVSLCAGQTAPQPGAHHGARPE